MTTTPALETLASRLATVQRDAARLAGDETVPPPARADLTRLATALAAATQEAAALETRAAAPGADAQLAWEHALHEERVLNERAGLFLVAQAMLLVFYATYLPQARSGTLIVVSVVGLLMSFTWSRLNQRQHTDLRVAAQRLKQVSPFYRAYLEDRGAAGGRNWDRFIIVVALPLMVAVIWVLLLLRGCCRILGWDI